MLFLEIIFFYLNYLLIDLYFNDFLSPVEILDNDYSVILSIYLNIGKLICRQIQNAYLYYIMKSIITLIVLHILYLTFYASSDLLSKLLK